MGHVIELEMLVRGAFEKRRFLDPARDFIVFEDDGVVSADQEDGRLSSVPHHQHDD